MRGIYEHVIETLDLTAQLKNLGMNVNEFFIMQFNLNSLPFQYGLYQINYDNIKIK